MSIFSQLFSDNPHYCSDKCRSSGMQAISGYLWTYTHWELRPKIIIITCTLLSLSIEGNVECDMGYKYSPVSIQISPVQLLASLRDNHTSEWHRRIKWPLWWFRLCAYNSTSWMCELWQHGSRHIITAETGRTVDAHKFYMNLV